MTHFTSHGYKDIVITPVAKTLNIDPIELATIRNALIPKIHYTMPKGYYSSAQLGKSLNLSQSNINKRLHKLKKNHKVQIIHGYGIASNGRKCLVPFYKILSS